jgi:flagellar hook-length control protein FliK
VPLAKPSVAPAVTADADDLSEPTATADAPATPTPSPEDAEANAAPQHSTDAETPDQASSRPQGPEAPARPQTANPVNEIVQATNPTPDSSHLAHLQSGRDVGQSVAANAQASQNAGASNSLASAPVPLESLAVEIASRALPGRSRFEIRLDPPELGRIDVRLDIDRSGNVTSRLVVEKAETLDVLRRDVHQLERALQDAGLKTSDNGMQFSLRDQAFAERHDRGDSHGARTLIADPELPPTEGATTAYGMTLRGGSGIDIRV